MKKKILILENKYKENKDKNDFFIKILSLKTRYLENKDKK
jgi:hypothetical protein